MIFGLIGALLTGGLSLAGDYVKGKQEEKRLKITNEQERIKNQGFVEKAAAEAKAKAMVTRMEGDIAWENIMAQGSLTSWKDEYITIFATSPYWLAMVPAIIGTMTDPMHANIYVNQSIDTIAKFPTALHALCGSVSAAAVGIRQVKDLFSFKKGVK